MLAGFHTTVADATIDAMVRACLPFSIEAVRQTCERYAAKEVDEHDYRFPPNSPQLVGQVRFMERVLTGVTKRSDGLVSYRMGEEPPPRAVPLGPIAVDFGHGRIDMSAMTPEEKDFVLTHKRRPDPPAQVAAPAPMIKRMAE